MKKFAPLLAAAIALAGLPAAPGAAAESPNSGQQQLAKLLKGREAGTPQRCISTFAGSNPQVFAKTAVVYRRGDTIWVNRTTAPDRLTDDTVLLIERHNGDELCRMDYVKTIDRISGQLNGGFMFKDFVPYTKPAATHG